MRLHDRMQLKPQKRPTARETAARILSMVIREKAYANIALRKTLGEDPDYDRRDRSFITELVNGCLRNLIYIDYTIEKFSNTAIAKMDPYVADTIRLAVYQIYFMDRVPARAAVSEAVESVKAGGFSSGAGFVNGVLRNIARSERTIPPDLSVAYSFPSWITELLEGEYGKETAEKIIMASMAAKKPDICANTLRTDMASLKKIMEEEDAAGISDIRKRPSYLSGLFHVMDAGAMKAVELLSPETGERLLDMCAAPGGKSFYAAYLMGDSGSIAAWDIYEHKIELIIKSAKRLGVTIIRPELRDAALREPGFSRAFDRVLLDAPCSGLGALRGRPEKKYFLSPNDIGPLVKLQKKLLNNAAYCVKPRGTLAYCTCTLTRAENEDNVRWFTENYPFRVEDVLKLLPCETSDGFYTVKMIKNE